MVDDSDTTKVDVYKIKDLVEYVKNSDSKRIFGGAELLDGHQFDAIPTSDAEYNLFKIPTTGYNHADPSKTSLSGWNAACRDPSMTSFCMIFPPLLESSSIDPVTGEYQFCMNARYDARYDITGSFSRMMHEVPTASASMINSARTMAARIAEKGIRHAENHPGRVAAAAAILFGM